MAWSLALELAFVIVTGAPPDEVRAPNFEDCKVSRGSKTPERCYVSATRAALGKRCSLFVVDIQALPSYEEICIGVGGSDIWKESFTATVVLGDACPCAAKHLVSRSAPGSFTVWRTAEKIEVTIGSQRTASSLDPREFPTAFTYVWNDVHMAAQFQGTAIFLKDYLVGFRTTDSDDDAICTEVTRKYPAETSTSFAPVARCRP